MMMKIPPNYEITPEILELLAKIDANRIILSSFKIPSEVKEKIQRRSLLQSSLFSAKIEGNPLTIEEMERKGESNQKKEVFNIALAAKFVDRDLKTGKGISLRTILKLHQLVMKGIGTAGAFRDQPGAIFNQAGVAVYLSPPPSTIKSLLANLLDFINSDKEKFPLVTAIISHLIFEKIHPFLDGNGRVGRLLIFTILKAKSYEFPLTIPFEKYLNDQRDEYYYHLDSGSLKTEDYLIFMLKAIYEETQTLIEQINQEKAKEGDLYLLPPRQEELMRIIKEHRIVSFDFLKRRFLKVPGRTLRYDLLKLAQKGLIVKGGVTRGSFYKVKNL